MRGIWIIEYRCGCSNDAPRKKDLLEYCGIHGADKRNIYFVPEEFLIFTKLSIPKRKKRKE